MDDLIQLVSGLSGPVPHMTMFFTLACIVGWWTKEVKATLTLMIVWSVGAECLQAYYPVVFDFAFEDIGWNVAGSAIGIFVTQVALFICGGWIQRSEGWNEIRREIYRGDYS